jgi:hypothetical protein
LSKGAQAAATRGAGGLDLLGQQGVSVRVMPAALAVASAACTMASGSSAAIRLCPARPPDAAAGFLDAGLGLGVELLGEAHQPVGEGEHGVVVAAAHGHALQQVLERHAGLLFQRPAFGLEGFLHAHGVDQHEAGLGAVRAVADALEAVAVEAAHAAALHLFVVAAAHVAHEQQHFQRLHVGAGGDHVHGHGDARVVVVAEAGEHAVGVFLGAVGDLLAEGVPWP